MGYFLLNELDMTEKESQYIEYEAKFYPVDKGLLRKALKDIGGDLKTAERKMRRIMFDERVYPGLKPNYLRIRDEGDCVRLSVKFHASKDGKIEDQKEIDVEVSDFDKCVEIFRALDITFNLYQETLRETWLIGKAEVVIDTWPGLEPFVEIEANSEEEVHSIATKLGFDWGDRIITSVVEIYMDVYDLSSDQTLTLLEYCTFENNPFAQLKKNFII